MYAICATTRLHIHLANTTATMHDRNPAAAKSPGGIHIMRPGSGASLETRAAISLRDPYFPGDGRPRVALNLPPPEEYFGRPRYPHDSYISSPQPGSQAETPSSKSEWSLKSFGEKAASAAAAAKYSGHCYEEHQHHCDTERSPPPRGGSLDIIDMANFRPFGGHPAAAGASGEDDLRTETPTSTAAAAVPAGKVGDMSLDSIASAGGHGAAEGGHNNPSMANADADKPPHSYATLIGKALLHDSIRKEGKTLREIYSWLENNFAYFRRSKSGCASWRSSVRHNLTFSKMFTRTIIVRNSDGKKFAYWNIGEDARSQFSDDGVYTRRRKTSGARNKGAADPPAQQSSPPKKASAPAHSAQVKAEPSPLAPNSHLRAPASAPEVGSPQDSRPWGPGGAEHPHSPRAQRNSCPAIVRPPIYSPLGGGGGPCCDSPHGAGPGDYYFNNGGHGGPVGHHHRPWTQEGHRSPYRSPHGVNGGGRRYHPPPHLPPSRWGRPPEPREHGSMDGEPTRYGHDHYPGPPPPGGPVYSSSEPNLHASVRPMQQFVPNSHSHPSFYPAPPMEDRDQPPYGPPRDPYPGPPPRDRVHWDPYSMEPQPNSSRGYTDVYSYRDY